VLLVISGFSAGENVVAPVDKPGADCGDRASVSSRKGFVDRGRSGRALVEEALDGDRARFLNGLFEPKLAAVGETWSEESQSTRMSRSLTTG
jgi:hypothetical protein